MLTILIIDHGECGLAFALRCAEYGHTVYWFIEKKEGTNQKSGTGMHPNIAKVKEWLPYAQKSDLIFCTENGNFLPKLEMLRARGYNVYAPSQKVADLEIKRGEGLKFLEDHGVAVPEYHTFKNIAEAKKFIIDNPRPFVFKTLGDNDDKALTFVGKTPQQLIQRITEWEENKVEIKGDVLLQEFIKGIEFGVSRWFGRDGPIGPIQETIEHKKLFNDEKGCNTGEMGTVLKYVSESKLYDLVLKPLEESLTQMGAYTQIDLNCIIDEEGNPWPLEFTSRPGWPGFNIQIYGHKGDPAAWMIDACRGKDTLKTTKDVLIGVVLTLPPFPYDDGGSMNTDNIPLYGLNDDSKLHVQPQSIKMGKYIDEVDGEFKEVKGWVSSGPYVAVVADKGKTVAQARENVYGIIDDLSMSDMGYRTDIGCKVIACIPELQALGFASDWPEEENE